MERRSLLSVIVAGVLGVSSFLIGCGGTNTRQSEASVGHKNNPGGVYRELGGWTLPPAYQGNPFGAGGIGSAWNFSIDGLFQYVRSSERIYNHIASDVDNSVPNQTTVHLRHDVKWNDGKPFTSKDVWAYYMLNNGAGLTRYLSGIEIPDDYTVVFKWASPSPINMMKMEFLSQDKQGEIPYHIYKQWVDKAASLLQQAKPDTNPNDRGKTPFGLTMTQDLQKQLNDNFQDFQKHGPALPVGTGPYMVSKVTPTDMILKKNPYFYDAKKVKFDTIDLKMVQDLSQQYALLKSGQIDHYDGTQPKDILESILASNKNLVHYRMVNYSCTGFLFNLAHTPFDNVTFRQAIIYALDRSKLRELANWYGHNTDLSSTGIPTGLVNQWVSPDILTKFTKYPHDEAKAAQLLTSIGWKKGTDGIWRDPSGKSYHFSIAADAGTVEWVNAGEAVAEQLTAFGLPTSFKAVDGGVYWTNATKDKGMYDMSFNKIDVSWSFNFPWNSMTNTYRGGPKDQAHLPKDSRGHAIMKATGFDGQSVDVEQLLDALPYMENAADRTHAIDEIAYVTNEAAWGVNIYQLVTGSWENAKMIGNLPWPDGITKYDRNLPEVAPNSPYFERILETNEGFSGDQWMIDGSYYPS